MKLILLLFLVIFIHKIKSLNPSVATYRVDQTGDIFTIYSTDPVTVWLDSSSSVNYFKVASSSSSSEYKIYDTTNGFKVVGPRSIQIDGSLVQLYTPKTTITICINSGCSSKGSVDMVPYGLVDHFSSIGTRGGSVYIYGKYFASGSTGNIVSFLDLSVPSKYLEFTVNNSNDTVQYFSVNESYSGLNVAAEVQLDYIPLKFSRIGSNYLNYIAPSIQSIKSQVDFTNAKNIITVNGDNFGLNPLAVTANLGGVDHNSSSIISVTSHTNITIVANPTVPAGTSVSVQVSIHNNPSNIVALAKISPIIQSVSTVYFQGGRLTISGLHLVVTPDTTVSVGGYACVSPTQVVQGLSLACTLGPSWEVNLPVIVSIGGAVSNMIQFSYSGPTLTNYSQDGSLITFYGVFENNSKLTFNNREFYPDQVYNTRLVFNLPMNLVDGLGTISATRTLPAMQVNLLPVPYKVTSPPTSGGVVTISAFWVGGYSISSAKLFDYGGCVNIVQLPNNPTMGVRNFTCSIGSGVGRDLDMQVRFSTLAPYNVSFAYIPPAITSVNILGDRLTIAGTNFGTILSKISFAVGPIACAKLETTVKDQYTIIVPESNDITNKITVFIDNQNATSTFTVHPTIFSMPNIPTRGGLATVSGKFFGPPQNIISFNIGNSYQCDNITTISSSYDMGTVYTCSIPPGEGKGYLFSINQTNNIQTTPLPEFYYGYIAPSLLGVSSIFEKTLNGTITLTGSNFGDNPIVVLNQEAGHTPFLCENVTKLDPSNLSCYINWTVEPPTIGYIYVNVTVGNQSFMSRYYVFRLYGSGQTDPPSEVTEADKKDKKWIIPVVIVVVVAGVIAIAILALYLVRREKKTTGEMVAGSHLKALRKF